LAGQEATLADQNSGYVRRGLIKTSEPTDEATLAELMIAEGYYRGAPHPTDSLARLQSLVFTRRGESKLYWNATGTWSYNAISQPSNDVPANDYSFATSEMARPIWGVLNKAGGMIVPAPTVPWLGMVFNAITYANPLPSWVTTYSGRGVINSDTYTFLGISVAPYTSRVMSISGGPSQRFGQVLAHPITLQIGYTGIDQRIRPLNAGYADASGKTLVLPDGTHPTEPILLDASGYRLASPGPATATYIDVNEAQGGFRELAFGGILPGCT